MSNLPLHWLYLDRELDMTLWAGFVGVAQDPATHALAPAIGWAVHHA
jgi:hypothetical protein